MFKKFLFSFSLIGLFFTLSCTNVFIQKKSGISFSLGEKVADTISKSTSVNVADDSIFLISCEYVGLKLNTHKLTVEKKDLPNATIILKDIPYNVKFAIKIEVSFNGHVIYQGKSNDIIINDKNDGQVVNIVISERKGGIKYECNGGDFSVEQKAHLQSAYFINESIYIDSVPTPKRKGFAFAGWYFDEKLENPASNFGTNDYKGDVTLYANWTSVPDVSNISYTTKADGMITLNWVNPEFSGFNEIVISRSGVDDITLNNATTRQNIQLIKGLEYEIIITTKDNNLNESIGRKITIPLYYFYNKPKLATNYVSPHAPTIAPPSDYGEQWEYMEYGVWPQSKKSASVTIMENEQPLEIYNNKFYFGDDGFYYVKHEMDYYKLEPIMWRILSKTYKYDRDRTLEGKLLLSENMLTTEKYNNDGLDNHYNLSSIRTYLNNTFKQNAIPNHYYIPVCVDNSIESTYESGENRQGSTGDFSCEDTIDDIFLLSQKEIIDPKYGFCTGKIPCEARIKDKTDYLNDTQIAPVDDKWWLRSPGPFTIESARTVLRDGTSYYFNYTAPVPSDLNTNEYAGVVPAMCIPNPEP